MDMLISHDFILNDLNFLAILVPHPGVVNEEICIYLDEIQAKY